MIKVIDLLNKIANNEELPKKIKWQGQIYEYSNFNRFYYQNSWSMYRDFYKEGNCLNDEVEIIEEPKKNDEVEIIEEPKKIKKIKVQDMKIQAESTGNYCYSISQPMKIMINKLNELTDEVNKLKEK